ncbi:hypothetical protein E4T56_gene9916 [Termitomyces sp. T112]|nr:hypothetical protein E4T56_gene9916 [Termitomyces sp. T112]
MLYKGNKILLPSVSSRKEYQTNASELELVFVFHLIVTSDSLQDPSLIMSFPGNGANYEINRISKDLTNQIKANVLFACHHTPCFSTDSQKA